MTCQMMEDGVDRLLCRDSVQGLGMFKAKLRGSDAGGQADVPGQVSWKCRSEDSAT